MDEAGWLACQDPEPMLAFLRGRASRRQLRLFAVGCCRRVWRLLPEGPGRWAVEVAERYADGGAGRAELDTAAAAARDAWAAPWPFAEGAAVAAAFTPPEGEAAAARNAARAAARAESDAVGGSRAQAAWVAARGAQCALLRDLFVSPFRPRPRLAPVVLAWNDGTVVRLARAMYDARDFGNMPLLADALLDAGADDEGLVGHCRAGGEHVRGCWAVDLVLGR
jgi:hypothetical protein